MKIFFKKKTPHGSLSKEFGKIAFATHLDIPMAEHHPKYDSFEEVKFNSPFISLELSCETERPSLPSLELEPYPFGHQKVVLDTGRESAVILHNENSYAMDSLETPTLESKRWDSINEHGSFTFETFHVSCSLSKYLEFVSLSAKCFYEDRSHL